MKTTTILAHILLLAYGSDIVVHDVMGITSDVPGWLRLGALAAYWVATVVFQWKESKPRRRW